MSRHIRRYLPILKKITRMGDRVRGRMIQYCDRNLIDRFSEYAKNLLKRNVTLNSRLFGRFTRKKKNVRALASKRTWLRKKRQIVQKKGFVGALLTLAIATLGNMLANRMLPTHRWNTQDVCVWTMISIAFTNSYSVRPPPWLRHVAVYSYLKRSMITVSTKTRECDNTLPN